MRRHFFEMRLGHLNKIAKYIIETYLERRDASVFNFLFLQLSKPVLALARASAQFIKLSTEAFTYHPAFP